MSYLSTSPLATKLEKAISDERIYKQLQLSNGILATLITDTRSEKSSCALSVRIGAAADCLPGLAHITEHAVFLGSEKYPIENAYKVFLNKHGGGGNAGTGMEHTTYKFNINAKAFDEALDIFSQFFKSPCFNHDSICREINAVDSEDSKNRILEGRRMIQIVKNLITVDTPYSKFSTGNIHTLAYGDIANYGNTLTQHIKTFHKQYYHPKEMAVCLIGPQDLDKLEQFAVKHFAGITDAKNIDSDTSSRRDSMQEVSVKDTPVATTSTAPLRLFRFGGNKLIKIKPIRDMRDLTIIWQLPFHADAYRINPCVLIGYLMNYKGPGSIFSVLQQTGYATALSAGIRTTFPNFTFFDINVSLSEQGLSAYEKVIEIIYSYIALLQQVNTVCNENKNGTTSMETIRVEMERLWKEMKIIKEINFHYQEQSSVYETAPAIASNMLDYDSAHILSVDGIFDETLSFPLFQDYVRCFTHDNSLAFLRSKTFSHLPDDQANFITTLTYEFEEYMCNTQAPQQAVEGVEGKENKENTMVRKWKHSGEYFDRFRSYYQEKMLSSPIDPSSAKLQMEPFYGITYELSEQPEHSQQSIDASIVKKLHLPNVNAFVSYQLLDQIHAKLQQESPSPNTNKKLLRSSPPIVVNSSVDDSPNENAETENNILHMLPWKKPNSLWHSLDEVFDTPKSILYFAFASGRKGPNHPVYILLNTLFEQLTVTKYYDASVAGLHFDIGFSKRGIGMNVAGYTEKLPTLLYSILQDILNPNFWLSVEDQLFENCKERLLRGLKSWYRNRPDSQADDLLSTILTEDSLLPSDKIRLCEEMTLPSLQQMVQQHCVPIQHHLAYAHGNIPSTVAQEAYEKVLESIRSSPSSMITTNNSASNAIVSWIDRVREIPVGQHTVVSLPAFNPEDPNNAYVVYFQTEKTSPRVVALSLLLRRLLAEPTFNELRTKQQLGYIVTFSSTSNGRGKEAIRGLEIRILSKRFPPNEMQQVVAHFLQSHYEQVMTAYTEEEITARCQALITSLQDPPHAFTEEASDFHDAIVNDLPFNRKELIIAELQSITLKDLFEALDKWIFNPQTRRSTAMMIYGNNQNAAWETYSAQTEAEEQFLNAPVQKITSLEGMVQWKDSLPFYPLSK